MSSQKRVAAIHDISGFGRCSLTVALPIISAAGIECAVMPTAVLSTHTGGIEGYTFCDLTKDMRDFTTHWQSLNLCFDGIYSGYLGSLEQIEIVENFIGIFRKNDTFALVDPAMADNGKMYPAFSMEFAKEMGRLCAKADVVAPNITEAAFMLGMEYKDGPYEKEYIEKILRALIDMGPSVAVLTGVCFDDKELGAACIDKTGKIDYYFTPRIEGYYHGTGDVYASVLTSALIKGKKPQEAIKIAVDFTYNAINRTKNAKTDIRFGVNFEEGLSELGSVLK